MTHPPPSEADRRRAAERYGILDTPPEAVFDRLTALAERLFNVPMALISITHGDREWFKARRGLDLSEFPRESSFCVHIVEGGAPMVVPDAAADPRFTRNPLVTGPPHIRFYAGAPLTTHDGFHIGSLSIADTRPRQFADDDRARLGDLARIAMDEIELRQRGMREAADLSERFQLLARATNDAIWDLDLVSGAVWRSGGYQTLFGYRPEQLGSTLETWRELLHPDDRERVYGGLQAFITREGDSWSDEYRFRRADGSWAEVLDRGFKMAGAGGRAVRMIGAMQDVSERKRSDRAQAAVLRIAEAAAASATLQELLRSIHEIVAGLMPAENFYIALLRPGTQTIDFPYLVDTRDPEMPRNLGRGLTAFVLRTGEPLLLDEEAQFDALVQSGEVQRTGPASVSWLGVPLKKQDQTVGVLVAQSYTDGVHYGERDKELLQFVSTQVARAIERKQAEESVVDSERRLRALIQHSSDGVSIVSAEGRVLFRSASVSRMMGFPNEEDLGLIGEYVHPDDRAQFEEKWREAVAKPGAPISLAARVRHRDGSWRVLDSVIVNFSGDPAVGGMVMNFRDVTERKQIEGQLMAADRMVSMGTLAAGVAHEINNPLSYVIANLAFVVDAVAQVSDPKTPETLELLREAQQGADRVRQIVRDLKTFARSDEAPPGPLDVHHVIEASINIAWHEIRHRARLVKDFGRALPPVRANEARLGQVLLNLLVNAAHAIAEGDAERNEIRIRTSHAGAQVTVEVTDTGAGIPPEHMARIFDPFFTTKPVGVGTGLGLFVCQGIVRSLGGSISAESEVGKGSTFRLVLPAASVAPEPSLPPPRAEARRARILAIDDEPLVGSVLSRALSAHEVVTLTSAVEALSLLRSGEKFDLIFCDLMMPHMTGMDFHGVLARELPALADRIVFLTGGAFTRGAREFIDRTKNRLVEKPFEIKAIRALVAELLR